jgi:hypothetical protein
MRESGDMLESFTIATFSALVGTTFEIVLDDQSSLQLSLAALTPLGEPSISGGRPPFSLEFVEAGGGLVPQRIYRMRHAELGEIDLFLVPLGLDARGMRYEAVFN